MAFERSHRRNDGNSWNTSRPLVHTRSHMLNLPQTSPQKAIYQYVCIKKLFQFDIINRFAVKCYYEEFRSTQFIGKLFFFLLFLKCS